MTKSFVNILNDIYSELFWSKMKQKLKRIEQISLESLYKNLITFNLWDKVTKKKDSCSDFSTETDFFPLSQFSFIICL